MTIRALRQDEPVRLRARARRTNGPNALGLPADDFDIVGARSELDRQAICRRQEAGFGHGAAPLAINDWSARWLLIYQPGTRLSSYRRPRGPGFVVAHRSAHDLRCELSMGLID